MFIEEMSMLEFQEFAQTHFIGNLYESINYALLKAEDGYDYEFICYRDTQVKAAALILYKKIGSYKYGYSPRGFLIDYSNLHLLKNFTNDLIAYYKKKNFAFIKINPEIAIAKFNNKQKQFEYNENFKLIENLESCGYIKLKDNVNFESILPRINAIVNLDDFNITNLTKNTRNKIKKAIRKGLVLEKSTENRIKDLYPFIAHKQNKSEYYYNDLFNVFEKNNSIDLLLVKIDYKKFLINSQNFYNRELLNNNYLNNKLLQNNGSNVINAKMNSDKSLLAYKNDIAEAAKKINENETQYIAGALVVKYQNRVMVYISGFDQNFARYVPNYFLYYAIIAYYKNDYKYLDLNGVTADLSSDNYYHGLNRFKMGFNPDIYEYIGEFDLPVDSNAYNHLLKSGLLAKELNK